MLPEASQSNPDGKERRLCHVGAGEARVRRAPELVDKRPGDIPTEERVALLDRLAEGPLGVVEVDAHSRPLGPLT